MCVLVPYLGVELTEDNPAAEREGKEENSSAENKLYQLRERQGQRASQRLNQRKEQYNTTIM